MMMTKAEIQTELSEISRIVKDLRRNLEVDEHLLPSGIDLRIAETCHSVVNLPPGDALEIRQILSTLMHNLKYFLRN